LLPFECNCLYGGTDEDRKYLDEVLQAYNGRLWKIRKDWQSKNLTEFAVVIQPFTIGLKIPDFSYLSDLDCFHPSLLANQKNAIAGWNSMITKGSEKKHYFDPNDDIKCPTNDTLLYID